MNAEIVVTENGNRIKPKDAMFPIYRQSKLQDFWDLCKFLCGDKIPRKEDVEIWKNIIEANTNEWLDVDFDLNLEKFLLIIQNSVSFLLLIQTYLKNETKGL
ncbi:MAG: hypothetical protein IPH96_18170 [Saprospiraceae bacterium]|nr:hypothetical protein [Saprospiraceae bacterium]